MGSVRLLSRCVRSTSSLPPPEQQTSKPTLSQSADSIRTLSPLRTALIGSNIEVVPQLTGGLGADQVSLRLNTPEECQRYETLATLMVECFPELESSLGTIRNAPGFQEGTPAQALGLLLRSALWISYGQTLRPTPQSEAYREAHALHGAALALVNALEKLASAGDEDRTSPAAAVDAFGAQYCAFAAAYPTLPSLRLAEVSETNSVRVGDFELGEQQLHNLAFAQPGSLDLNYEELLAPEARRAIQQQNSAKKSFLRHGIKQGLPAGNYRFVVDYVDLLNRSFARFVATQNGDKQAEALLENLRFDQNMEALLKPFRATTAAIQQEKEHADLTSESAVMDVLLKADKAQAVRAVDLYAALDVLGSAIQERLAPGSERENFATWRAEVRALVTAAPQDPQHFLPILERLEETIGGLFHRELNYDLRSLLRRATHLGAECRDGVRPGANIPALALSAERQTLTVLEEAHVPLPNTEAWLNHLGDLEAERHTDAHRTIGALLKDMQDDAEFDAAIARGLCALLFQEEAPAWPETLRLDQDFLDQTRRDLTALREHLCTGPAAGPHAEWLESALAVVMRHQELRRPRWLPEREFEAFVALADQVAARFSLHIKVYRDYYREQLVG